MKRIWLLILLCLMLCGCGSPSHEKPVQDLRRHFSDGGGCRFSVMIDADFGESVYSFSLDCTVQDDGDLKFTVLEPVSIEGISGEISAEDGKLSYDNVILGFPLLVQGEISPVACPWLLCQSVTGGYLRAFSKEDMGLRVTIDDTFRGEELRMDVWLNDSGDPVYAELIWEGRRLASMRIDDFERM